MSAITHRAPRGQDHVTTHPGERGASLVEYALLVALIAVVCIAAVAFLGTSSSDTFGRAGGAVNNGKVTCPDGWHLVDQNNDGVLVCQPG